MKNYSHLEVIKTMSYGIALTGNFKVGASLSGYGDMTEEDLADSEDINILEEIEGELNCI